MLFQELLHFGPWVGQQEQFDLLTLFVCEFGMTLANEDKRFVLVILILQDQRTERADYSFLTDCASWIGEGRHLDLLDAILKYGFNPSNIDSPLFEKWPAPCSPDWRWEEGTPDPFFIEYLAALVKDNPGVCLKFTRTSSMN